MPDAPAYRPNRLARWWQDFHLSGRVRNALLILTTLVGLGVYAWHARAAGSEATAAAATPEYAERTVQVTGRMLLPPGVDREAVQLVLHLPEVPLDVRRKLADVCPTGSDRFAVVATFAAASQPTYGTLSVRAEGYQSLKTDRLRLLGDPPAAETPNLTLQRLETGPETPVQFPGSPGIRTESR